MAQQSLSDKVCEFIAGIAWHIYLWSARMTEEQFLAEHERQALAQIAQRTCPDCGGELQLLERCISCQHLQAVNH